MLRTLSYLNLIFSVAYFLGYLQNASRWVVLGLLSVVVFNWMVLVNAEREQFKWSVLQWAFAGLTLLFALFIGYSAVQLLLDAVEHAYYPGSNILLIAAGMLFTLVMLCHLFLSGAKTLVKKDE